MEEEPIIYDEKYLEKKLFEISLKGKEEETIEEKIIFISSYPITYAEQILMFGIQEAAQHIIQNDTILKLFKLIEKILIYMGIIIVILYFFWFEAAACVGGVEFFLGLAYLVIRIIIADSPRAKLIKAWRAKCKECIRKLEFTRNSYISFINQEELDKYKKLLKESH